VGRNRRLLRTWLISASLAILPSTGAGGRPEPGPAGALGGIEWRCRLAQALYWAGFGRLDSTLIEGGVVGMVRYCR
jgi:hypothetical protein